MFLIFALGNPGPQYRMNRHNIGFQVVQSLGEEWGIRWKTEHKALVGKAQWDRHSLLLAQPQTYMNLVGNSLRPLMDYYGLTNESLLVIQDDIDQGFGQIRFHKKRGHGGHNGIRHLHQTLGTDDYCRLKIGVGRPPHPEFPVADYVLQDFSKVEREEWPDLMEKCSSACKLFLDKGYTLASNKFNIKDQK